MTADPARWLRVKEILADALELDQSARDEFLQRACGEDQEMLEEVKGLLAGDDSTETVSAESATAPLGQGRRIGPYVLQHRIGSGGIGQVWAATRVDDVRMRVAIKLLRTDHEDDERFQRRFRAEMQILALMRHPNIVTFLDAGITDTHQPYFAMEYVEGEPITAFCNKRRLSVAQRLELFLQVCEAVQYAHKHALLHRDLKPGNILVDAEGTVKLLDFGIAKLLRPEILGEAEVFTRPMSNPMTPEYASPEQLMGSHLTTASDIYSLGVVLFEMLTNRTPFSSEGKDLLKFRELRKDSDPPPPSTAIQPTGFREFRVTTATQLRKELSGELDNIVLMALRHEPDRRYGTAAELADDIRRYRDGLPVRAQPDSFWYHTRKFVKRRRVEVAAVCLVILSLAVGLGEALRERNVAQVQRDLANRRLDQVRQLAQSFESTFQSFERSSRPGEKARRELAAAEQQVALQPENRELQENLARSYETIADALGLNGQTSEAERLAAKAVAICETMANGHPSDTAAQSALSTARALLAKVKARSTVLGSVPSAAHPPTVITTSPEVVSGYEQLGEMLRLTGDVQGAIQAYSSAAAELGLSANAPESKRNLSRLYGVLAELCSAIGDSAKALEYRRLVERMK